MANKIKPARAVKNRIETVKETLEPYELIISTDTEQIAYKKSNNEVAYMANEKNIQEKLVSGVNIKTVGMQSLLGSGNIPIPSTEEFASKQELAPYISSKNLGGPDLKGKEYLGDGWYRIYNIEGLTLAFNVFNGVYNLDGVSSVTNWIQLFKFSAVGDYTFTIYNVNNNYSGSSVMIYIENPQELNLRIFKQQSKISKTVSITTQNTARFLAQPNIQFTNYRFKVQMEKGTEATPFAVPAGVIPYIPEVKKANEWFLVATNSVAGGDIISIPNNLNELLIIANEHSTVHLPNISQASGLSVRTLGSGVVNTGANWRTTTTTIVKSWSDGTTAQSTEYKIYGR